MSRILTAAVVAWALVLLPGCGDNVTDCHVMQQSEGTRLSNSEYCMCTFLYPEPDPPQSNPVGPPCDRKCVDSTGEEIPDLDCNATPPF